MRARFWVSTYENYRVNLRSRVLPRSTSFRFPEGRCRG
jgi:hypothetical protein